MTAISANGRQFVVLYGSSRETRSLRTIITHVTEGDSLILVDGATLQTWNSNFSSVRVPSKGNIGIHALSGVHLGVPFNQLDEHPEQVLATRGQWVLLQHDKETDSLYLESLMTRGRSVDHPDVVRRDPASGIPPTVGWIFAFPGMGKSTLAHADGRFVDLDGGIVRRALSLPKRSEITQNTIRIAANYHLESGRVVLNNEPELMKFARRRCECAVVLPSFPLSELVARLESREEEGSAAFAKLVAEHGMDWTRDWEARALQLGIPVYRANYLSDLIGWGEERLSAADMN
jgi:hypothetical protein